MILKDAILTLGYLVEHFHFLEIKQSIIKLELVREKKNLLPRAPIIEAKT